MALAKSFKTVLRKVGGRIVPFKVAFTEARVEGLRSTIRDINTHKTAFSLWKKFRSDVALRRSIFKPGGILDPHRRSIEMNAARKEWDKNYWADIVKRTTEREPHNDILRAKAKKAADKAASMSRGIMDVIKGEFKPSPSYSPAKLLKKLKANISKDEFLEVLSETKIAPNSVHNAAAEFLSPRELGGSGYAAFKRLAGQRKWYGKKLMREAAPQLPKAANIDRIITAKGKGIRFVRIRGRIVPIRPKKGAE